MVDRKSEPTLNRYVAVNQHVIRPRFMYAALASSPVLSENPAAFMAWLATAGAHDWYPMRCYF